MLLVKQLAGVFTGAGFAEKSGRHPVDDDCDFLRGPIDILCSSRNGSIIAMGPGGSLTADGGGQEVDGTGLVATAGLIDSHTHAIFAGDRSPEYFRRWAGNDYVAIGRNGGGIHETVRTTAAASDNTLVDTLCGRLQAMRALGSTVVEVKSGYGGSAAGELRLLRLIRATGERLRNVGPELRVTFLGLHALPPDRDESGYCDDMIRILPEIARDGLADHVDAFPERGFMTLNSARRFLCEASNHGFSMSLHADELTPLGGAEAAIALGARSVDHLQHVSDTAIESLGREATVATLLPATALFSGLAQAPARRLLSAGARVALATDFNPGTAPAHDLQLTMFLAAAMLRMTAAEIFCAVTYNAAVALGLGESHGFISPGRVANMALWPVCVADNPVAMLEEIVVMRRSPAYTIVKGRY